MNNAEKFKKVFGMYATELWAMPEEKFVKWLNEEVHTNTISQQEQDEWTTCGKKLYHVSGCISFRTKTI